ncbi:MAG: LL-diaminopimelate aminotransferase [Coriobacteriales bacterium]|nr:LL-diaminopimelate aminotransferase [Coriobacteriales bacterium]
MSRVNLHYLELKDSYLFRTIDRKTTEYLQEHPGQRLLRLGIGDVTLPLAPVVIEALHEAVRDQADKASFHGYMPEVGAPFLRKAIAGYYAKRGVQLQEQEVFVSSGASDDLGDLLDIFQRGIDTLLIEPAYPAYRDANVMAGNNIISLDSSERDGFAPWPDASISADVVYLCSPNNPTGAVYSRDKLAAWVAWAREKDAIIIFDAAYEAFIQDDAIPHSIYEIEGAKSCAIEVCSLSKTAGFTGTRCGYTIVPLELVRNGASLNAMWVRNRCTKTNGISYILQRGAEAVFTDEGQKQVHEAIALYKANAGAIMEALDACGIWYCGGRNAPYIWLKAPGGMSSWELFDTLLERCQVVGTPGSGFGDCGEGFFRLTIFGSPADTREAAARIKALWG